VRMGGGERARVKVDSETEKLEILHAIEILRASVCLTNKWLDSRRGAKREGIRVTARERHGDRDFARE